MGNSELIDYQMINFISFISRWGNQPQFSDESCGIFCMKIGLSLAFKHNTLDFVRNDMFFKRLLQ